MCTFDLHNNTSVRTTVHLYGDARNATEALHKNQTILQKQSCLFEPRLVTPGVPCLGSWFRDHLIKQAWTGFMFAQERSAEGMEALSPDEEVTPKWKYGSF